MQKKQNLLVGKLVLWLNFLVAIVLLGSIYGQWRDIAIPAVSIEGVGLRQIGLFSWHSVLDGAIPGLTAMRYKTPAQVTKSPFAMYPAICDAVEFLTNIDSRNLKSVLQAEMPWLATLPVTVQQSAQPLAVESKAVSLKSFADGKPVVGIYHTHTAESFIPSSGVTHRPGGQIGEICEVGGALADTLQKNGIAVLQDLTIHDSPSFMKAYGASEITVTKMVKDNPSLQIIFDIHRDAEKRENVITQLNGETVATFSIIVAQGQPDLPQPLWKQNYALAKIIERKCNERYLGLARGIQLVEWRYNQHLHPHALLLEVGSHETSTAEGIRTMQLLGDVLTELLREGTIKGG